MKLSDIAEVQETLGYTFHRPELLCQAMTHSSHARESEAASPPGSGPSYDNEQLEFLGDAVLSLITSEELFQRFPNFREGELSKVRAHLVSEKHLIQVAQRLQIGPHLRLGRGEEKSGGRTKTALLVDALEAVLGAMYLDGGLSPARGFVLSQVIGPELEAMAKSGSKLPIGDYKSALQERLQAEGLPQPFYTLVKEEGPEHKKTFTVEAHLRPKEPGANTEFVGRAVGPTKKSAEQDAARQVLDYLATSKEYAGPQPKGQV